MVQAGTRARLHEDWNPDDFREIHRGSDAPSVGVEYRLLDDICTILDYNGALASPVTMPAMASLSPAVRQT